MPQARVCSPKGSDRHGEAGAPRVAPSLSRSRDGTSQPSMELCGLSGKRGPPCLRNAPARALQTDTLCHDETPNALGVLGFFFSSFFLSGILLPLRTLGNRESVPPKPLNAQTARDRDRNTEPMSSGHSVSVNKHAVKVFPRAVKAAFQYLRGSPSSLPHRPAIKE